MLSRVVRTFPSEHRLLITGTPLQNNLHVSAHAAISTAATGPGLVCLLTPFAARVLVCLPVVRCVGVVGAAELLGSQSVQQR